VDVRGVEQSLNNDSLGEPGIIMHSSVWFAKCPGSLQLYSNAFDCYSEGKIPEGVDSHHHANKVSPRAMKMLDIDSHGPELVLPRQSW
jgi:hypothetical protein